MSAWVLNFAAAGIGCRRCRLIPSVQTWRSHCTSMPTRLAPRASTWPRSTAPRQTCEMPSCCSRASWSRARCNTASPLQPSASSCAYGCLPRSCESSYELRVSSSARHWSPTGRITICCSWIRSPTAGRSRPPSIPRACGLRSTDTNPASIPSLSPTSARTPPVDADRSPGRGEAAPPTIERGGHEPKDQSRSASSCVYGWAAAIAWTSAPE
jgi:hypothetical protein